MINKLKRYDVEDLTSSAYVRPYEEPMCAWVKFDDVESLQTDLLEAYKAIVDKHLEYNDTEGVFICIHCFEDSGCQEEFVKHKPDCIVLKSEKFIEGSK